MKALGRTIFAGGLPYEAELQDLTMYFSDFGMVMAVKIPKARGRAGKRKGRIHKGYAFIEFEDPDVTKEVLDIKDHYLPRFPDHAFGVNTTSDPNERFKEISEKDANSKDHKS